MRCPYCAARNHAGVRFCIECGEPLDGAPPVARLRPDPATATAAPPPGAWPVRLAALRGRIGWEVILGVLVILLIIGWDASNRTVLEGRDAQAASLRRGLAAAADQHWAAAVEAYRAAGDYHDARTRLAAAEATLARLTTLWGEAEAARQAGAWSAATLDYGAVAALQPDYEQVAARLVEARRQAGPVVYRRPDSAEAALWWAAIDGSNPHPIAGTNSDSVVQALSPDGRWLAYSTYFRSGPRYGTRLAWLLDTVGNQTLPVTLPGGTRPIVQDVVFRRDGQGYWGTINGQGYYADLRAGAGAVVLQPCAPEIVARDPATGRTILLRPDVPPAAGATFYLSDDPQGRAPRRLLHANGLVDDVLLNQGGTRLVYRAATVDDTGRLRTDRLVAVDLSTAGALSAPPQQVITEMTLRTGEDAPPRLRAHFLTDVPGSRLLITQPGTPGWVYDPATDGRWVPVTGDDSSWHSAAGSLVGSRSGRWLGLEAWTVVGTESLAKLMMQPMDGGPIWSLLVPANRALWLGFSGDERYAFYSVSMVAQNGWTHRLLLSVPTPDGLGGPSAADVTPLVRQDIAAPFMLRDMALTRDGRRLLVLMTADQRSALPGAPAYPPGLYTLRPDGTAWNLLAAGATEFWTSGGPEWAVDWVP